jgi:hypothetical protein
MKSAEAVLHIDLVRYTLMLRMEEAVAQSLMSPELVTLRVVPLHLASLGIPFVQDAKLHSRMCYQLGHLGPGVR